MLGSLRNHDFSVALASHAFSSIDAYVYGFVLTEVNLPFEPGESVADFAAEIGQMIPASEYPHLVEMMTEQVVGKNYAYADEFQFGLDLILDSLSGWLAE